MCGIAGKVYLGSGLVRESDIQKMTDKIAHRGPDDEGVYVSRDRKVGLGNRRLSIIDLSKNGRMPMNYKNRYYITYNGEIYNFKTEKEKLLKLGYKFKSNTDTEVVLALYDKYKEKCLSCLRGMFSFALYDAKEETLFLAVGKLGKKPLKYYWDGTNLIFASELKAILTQREVGKSIDWVAIHNYLTFGYVFSPRTGFNNIYKLRGGHYIFVDLKRRVFRKERYWKLDFNNKLYLSENEWVEKIISKLREATKLRMVSDVPLGALLSGGVDSSMIVALMAQESRTPIKTFTIGFDKKHMDETKFARKVARMYGTDHEELLVRKNSVELLPYLAYQFEEPFFDPSAVVTYLVSKMAGRKVKVILNGDGGDENFAGYDRYLKVGRDSFLENYKFFLSSTRSIFKYLSGKYPKLKRADNFLQKLNLSPASRFVTYNNLFQNSEKVKMYSLIFNDMMKGINSHQIMEDLFEESEAIDPRDRALYADINMYLPEDLLVKVDIASMANSLEGRSPFLDSEFVELAAQIPYSLKVRGNTLKYILKKSAEGLVPMENIYRPKMGFSMPLREWFSEGLTKFAGSKLLSKKANVNSFLNKDEIRRMIKGHSLKNDFGPKIWALLTLELWIESYFN